MDILPAESFEWESAELYLQKEDFYREQLQKEELYRAELYLQCTVNTAQPTRWSVFKFGACESPLTEAN